MSFLNRIFSGRKEDVKTSTPLIDEKNEYLEEKKTKFNKEEAVLDNVFYVHEKPKEENGDEDMPMNVEQHDQVSSPNQLLIRDDKTGAERPMTREEAAGLMTRNVPPGINVPGAAPANKVKRPPTKGKKQTTKKAPQNIDIQQTEQNPTYPPLQMAMVEGAYHIFIDLAGVKKEDLQVTLDNGHLVIVGKRINSIDALRKEIKKGKRGKDPILNAKSTVQPSLFNKFKFRFPFNRNIDEPNMVAKFDMGVLYVILPHLSKGKETTIPIM